MHWTFSGKVHNGIAMTDVFSKAKRSDVMSRIRSRGNEGTEIAFVGILRKHRLKGWRRHHPLMLTSSSGRSKHCAARSRRVRPDFVFQEIKLAVFVDGCFWHGCPEHGTRPTGNRQFWESKLESNRARDRFVTRQLRRKNWSVLRIWEHQLEHGDRVAARVKRAIAQIAVDRASTEPAQRSAGMGPFRVGGKPAAAFREPPMPKRRFLQTGLGGGENRLPCQPVEKSSES
jgi:DNA mismatch endonuclease (patch repair protein)